MWTLTEGWFGANFKSFLTASQSQMMVEGKQQYPTLAADQAACAKQALQYSKVFCKTKGVNSQPEHSLPKFRVMCGTTQPGSSLVERGAGWYLPNCQTNLVIDLYTLSLLFCKFINTTAYTTWADTSRHLLILKSSMAQLSRYPDLEIT